MKENEELKAQITAIDLLLEEAKVRKGEIIVACAKYIWDERYDIRPEKVEEILGIFRTIQIEQRMKQVIATTFIVGVATS
jgi:hypothetical protein